MTAASRVTTASPAAPSARRPRSSFCAPTSRGRLLSASFAASFLLSCSSDAPRHDASPPHSARPEPTLTERIDGALSKAGRFLVSKQGADGGFHSDVYPYFRDGRALTPMALLALWAVPDQGAIDPAYRKGVDFLAAAGTAPRDYPVYTLSATLLVLGAPRNERHAGARAAIADAIVAQQQSDGGWSYGGEPSNLSSTLFAVGALRLGAGKAVDDPALVRAKAFVERCQNFAATGADPALDDGGFIHSPDMPDGNKAGPAGTDAAGHPRFRSYGSMTADGVRALLRLGATPDDPRVVAAKRWLVSNYSAEQNPGTFPERDEVRRRSGYYYWAWTGAHAMRVLGERAWAEPLARAILARQGEDGSWKNPSTEMREDDALVATPLAAAALAVARTVVTGELRSHAADPRR